MQHIGWSSSSPNNRSVITKEFLVNHLLNDYLVQPTLPLLYVSMIVKTTQQKILTLTKSESAVQVVRYLRT
jgi:hypothetical protein